MKIRTGHIHSVLFLISRAFLLCAFIPSWKSIRTSVLLLLTAFSFHQFILYLRRSYYIDERTFSSRACHHHIFQSTGPIGKLIAGLHVYFWEFYSYPHPINLLHWLELSIFFVIFTEYTKGILAKKMELQFFWDSDLMTLCLKDASAGKTVLTKRKGFCDIVSKLLKEFLAPRASDSIVVLALNKSPSIIIFLFWLAFGRKSFSSLQSDPRERAFHMDSTATHMYRLQGIQKGHPVSPKAFGVDMRKFFEPGVSRKIYIQELEDDACRDGLQEELTKDRPGLTNSLQDTIDHESIFCISYRHLEDRNEEGVCLLVALQLAAQLAKAKGYDYFRIWMDKILRQCDYRDSQRWAFYGLLPYCYYPVIAVRNITQDEGERMWLLAEERLAYGNMGLYEINVRSVESTLRIIDGINAGPENSMRVYLRYLRTEESTEEKTFHLEDRRRFEQLAYRHGKMDDEEQMYEQLRCETLRFAPKDDPQADIIWWPAIYDVESYSVLRKEAVKVDLIDFELARNVPFDGYREWFKWKDERFYSMDGESSRPFETQFFSHTQNITAYACSAKLHCGIVLLTRGYSGLVQNKVACLLLLVEKKETGFRILKHFRIRLRYDKSPTDDVFLQVAIRLLDIEGEEDGRIVKVDLSDLKFI